MHQRVTRLNFKVSNLQWFALFWAIGILIMLPSFGADALKKETASAELALLKKRYLQLLVPKGLDVTLPEVKRLHKGLVASAEKCMNLQIMDRANKAFGSWPVLKVAKAGVDGDTFNRNHISSLRRLAKAYAMPGTKLEGDGKLLKHIVAALEFTERHTRPGSPRRGNWWAWDVGIPGGLANSMLFVEGKLPVALKGILLKALYSLVRKKYSMTYKGGGANVLYVALNQLRVAMVTGRLDYAKAAASSYTAMSSRKGKLGIQKDYSYHFHGHGLNMGYGREQLKFVSQFLYLTSGTSFALSKAAQKTHEDWFRNFIVWNSFKGRVSPFSIGRSIARNRSVESTVELEAAIFLYLCEGGSCRELAHAFIGEWYEANPDKGFYNATLAALAPSFEPGISKAKTVPTGARYFPQSDYLACRMPKFYASVRMSSTRTKASFSIRDENLRASRSGDGTLALMTDGSEWDNEVIPTMNWYALSGATVANGLKVKPEQPGHSSFVGGLSHRGQVGVAGFDFLIGKAKGKANGKAKLVAKKSYMVFERGVMLMGSGIRLENHKMAKGAAVYTSLHQCPLREGDKQITVDGVASELVDGTHEINVKRWIHIRNYGYWFPQPTTIKVSVGSATRGFDYINKRYRGDKKFTRRFYRVWIDHGLMPKAGSYAVTILPAATVEETKAYAEKPTVSILTQTEDAHIMKDATGNVTSGIFFKAGKASGFTVSKPVVFALSREEKKYHITAQDPSFQGGKVKVVIQGALKVSGGARVDATANFSLERGSVQTLSFPVEP